ncbi:hypothetical protein V8F33_008590 [Rhypophila sp. PSN 637]
MAPTRPKQKKSKNRDRATKTINVRKIIDSATESLAQGAVQDALTLAKDAYKHVGEEGRQASAVLSLLGQIYVELGEVEKARNYFLKAVSLDEDGTLPEDLGGGPEKFLWLAQLSEEGGQDSISWFERGASVLRSQIQSLKETIDSRPQSRGEVEAAIFEKNKKLAETLCAEAEVYMTDLSWEEDAEQQCERLTAEAVMLADDVAETWQTLANVRISQTRTEEAKEALKRSIGIWSDLPPEDPRVPPYPTRVSLARLLIEVGMEEEAIAVNERLISEDDTSVEVWYLGGYGRYTMGEKLKQGEGATKDDDSWQAFWRSSRKWLTRCLKIFDAEEYEDEKLREHAQELLESIKAELGEAPDDDDDEDEVWEDTDGEDVDSDVEMD